MTARNFIVVGWFFLLSAGESLSLKPLAKAPYLHHTGRPLVGVSSPPQQLFTLRGGEVAEDRIDSNKPTVVPSKSSIHGILSILDASGITGTLTVFGKFYSSALESSPVLTKSITAAVLFAISDQMAQLLEMKRNAKKPSLAVTSKKRSLFSALVGLLYFGPMAHLWYGWIFRTFPGKSVVSILQKAALGQFFFAPPLFCVFFAAALLQNGQFTMGNWIQKIRQDLVKGWLGGIGFWPVINYISYGFVPQKWIPLFINVMGLVFNIYVSLIANLKQKEDPRATIKKNN